MLIFFRWATLWGADRDNLGVDGEMYNAVSSRRWSSVHQPGSRSSATMFPTRTQINPHAFSLLAPSFLNALTPLFPRPRSPPSSVRSAGYDSTWPLTSPHAIPNLAPSPLHLRDDALPDSTGTKQPLTGAILTQHELVNLARHPSRDVAALGLRGAAAAADDDKVGGEEGGEERRVLDIRSRGIPFSPLPLRRRLIDQSDALQIVGYEVRENPGVIGQAEDPRMMMVRAKGELAARTAAQAFVRTNHATLNPGMCGAAVLDGGMELCGCVEGVVPTPPPGAEVEDHVRALQGMPCVVEWKDLDALLKATMDAEDADGGADDQ